ncbi:hypothetical protein YC2023_094114 [Brassica napus]
MSTSMLHGNGSGYVEAEAESFVSVQIWSFWFRSKVSGGESRRVRTVAVSPMKLSGRFLVSAQSRVIVSLPVTVRGSLSIAVVVLGSVCVQAGVVALGLLSPLLIKCGGSVFGYRLSSVLGGASPEEAFLAGPTALYGPWVQGCIRSRVVVLEAAIFNALHRTTASSVVRSSSCCRSRVFQGLRAPFSPVAHGDW